MAVDLSPELNSENSLRCKGGIGMGNLTIVVGIAGIVVTIISIIVTIISIRQTAAKDKHQKSNRPDQG